MSKCVILGIPTDSKYKNVSLSPEGREILAFYKQTYTYGAQDPNTRQWATAINTISKDYMEIVKKNKAGKSVLECIGELCDLYSKSISSHQEVDIPKQSVVYMALVAHYKKMQPVKLTPEEESQFNDNHNS